MSKEFKSNKYTHKVQLHRWHFEKMFQIYFRNFWSEFLWIMRIEITSGILALWWICFKLFLSFLWKFPDNSMYRRSFAVFLYGRHKYQRHRCNDAFESMHQPDWHGHYETNRWNWWSHTYRLDALLSSAWSKSFSHRRFRRNCLRFLWNGNWVFFLVHLFILPWSRIRTISHTTKKLHSMFNPQTKIQSRLNDSYPITSISFHAREPLIFYSIDNRIVIWNYEKDFKIIDLFAMEESRIKWV